ncbi:MAG TPA: glycoside hydrolase family 92 protein [Bacteroides sp.]|nr:glycoside hydrolase family 92 protein [Bacteroides sp.]
MRTKGLVLLTIIFASLIFTSCDTDTDHKTPLEYVDMLIGTARKGHTIISTARPFAMVKPGPDTDVRRNYLHAKYITGFSQLHISGTGGNAQSGVLGVMPTTGKLNVNPGQYRSGFDATQGVAEPGYYNIMLEDYNIRSEITSTDRVVLYRFTFPKSDESHILLDVSHAFNKYRGGEIRIVNNTTLEGTGKYNGYHGSDFDVAFVIEFSRPFKSSGVWKGIDIMQGEDYATVDGADALGAYLDFQTGADDTIYVKIGMSYVDIAGAKSNIEAEMPDWDFEKVFAESREGWNALLGNVKISGGTEDQKTTFYTALYHTMISTCMLSDADGRYEGFDGKIHQADGFTYYGEFSLWDTYRTAHPLYSLLQPQRQSDMVKSLLAIAEQGGWLPKWAWSEGYTGGMLGDHAVSVILDSYVKGIRDFDALTAYDAMRKNAMEKLEGVPWGRRGLRHYKALGFAPEDAGYMKSLVAATNAYGPGGSKDTDYYPEISGSASATLEFAYNDWCVAEMARLLNKTEDADYFGSRAYNYKNVYDPEVGFMRPRNSDGSWAMNPFVSTISGQHSQFYCEGNAWTYSWTVQHDVQGLINLMGGNEAFISLLDSAFSGLETGQSYFDPTNEPDIHYPYLYNYAGAPWKTQETVRYITDNLFTADHEQGLPGDEDAGTMSAWYIFSAMGFYPVAPGSEVYVIGSPVFDKIEISLDEKYYGGKTFIMESHNNSSDNKYIQEVSLNGEPLNRTRLTHEELIGNGYLVFTMGNTPNNNWGTAEGSAPHSMTREKPDFVYSGLKAPETAKFNEYVDVQVTVTNKGGMGTAHTVVYHYDRNAHYRTGHLVGENKLVLASGESRDLKFRVPLYFHGNNTLHVDTLSTTVIVSKPVPKELVK